ncbi:katanin p60 ATPase-containing subunit [Klebsormidium nitens]|uniref:Katanin p60 ATPase-containing subunit n=1 Tax=Klebsormidium nitens TaxID=105231 RepID=A0A1Y1IFT3_KLENI|nr:katanin p60 ATPase-containing subunit [Klebsormidium nitens]|eukprot:GAQ87626.1 katanin p60 ATPase-containing subunit [Klebsormidium nitens]
MGANFAVQSHDSLAPDEDEALPTRWTYQEIDHYYEVKLGRSSAVPPQEKKVPREIQGWGARRPLVQLGMGSTTSTQVNAGPAAAGPTERKKRSGARPGGGDVTYGAAANGRAPVGGSERVSVAVRRGTGRLAGSPSASESSLSSSDVDGDTDAHALPPPPDFGSVELQEMASLITADIVVRHPNVRWKDVAGLEEAKRLLKEAVVMPIKYPQYFTGLLTPWKGILLYGPPGTGKTMLAKAVATECGTTFFNISASTIVSKWRGDSEKLVRVLFQLARHYAPSTIFMDELDALIAQRGEGPGENEASRRMKTELLVQMDGLSQSEEMVFVLAATNLPWELDTAMLRRLEKRILVPLPGGEARLRMLQHLLPPEKYPGLVFVETVEKTAGYSGSDVRLVCKEAAMRPLRRLMSALDEEEESGSDASADSVLGPVTMDDLRGALQVTKPSAHVYAERFQKFHDEFGSHFD